MLDEIIRRLDTDQRLDTLMYVAEQFADLSIAVINVNNNAIGIRGVQVLRPLLTSSLVLV